jgi:glycerol-3-phosphate dehydrogenase
VLDHLTDDRALVNATIASARRHGAQCEEHAEVLSYRHDPERNLYEVLVGKKKYVCRKLVNASGAWVDELRARAKERGRDLVLPVAGAHVNTRPFLSRSVLLQAPDGRFFFVIHLPGLCRIGTTERLNKDPDRVEATKQEVDYLLASAARYFPGARLSKKDLLSTDAGVRPLAAPRFEKDPNQVSREHEIRVGPSGVIHVLGVKLTDHRRAAQEVLDRLMPSLLPYHPKARRRTSTHKVPL